MNTVDKIGILAYNIVEQMNNFAHWDSLFKRGGYT